MRGIFFFIGLSLTFGNFAHAGGSTLDCPTDFTDDSLETFRDAAVTLFVNGNYDLVNSKLKSCFPGGKPAPCLAELQYEGMLKAKGRSPSIRSEFEGEDPMTDPYLSIKSNKDLPKEFRVGSDRVRIPPDILNLSKQKEWKAVSYKTRSTGGFDNPANLTLVAIPGKDFDIYLQISPHPNDNPQSNWTDPVPHPPDGDISHGQRTLTIITVDKTRNPPVGQLRLMRDERGEGSYAWNNNLQSQSCVACHSVPLRSISPRGYRVTNGDEQPMPKATADIVTEINAMMLVDNVSWGDAVLPDVTMHRGVSLSSHPLGWAPENSRTRKEDFLKNCAQDSGSEEYHSIAMNDEQDIYRYSQSPQHMSSVRTRKIAAAMNCTQCHNNSIRGFLSDKFSRDEVKFKILVDRSMPPGADLTADERLALLNCLYDEKQAVNGQWKQSGTWFKRDACETMDVSPSATSRTATAPATDSTTE